MNALLERLRKLTGKQPVVRVILTEDDAEAIAELLAFIAKKGE